MVQIFCRSVDIHHMVLTFDPLTLNMRHMLRSAMGYVFPKFEISQLNYNLFAADTLRHTVTLTFDDMILNICRVCLSAVI